MRSAIMKRSFAIAAGIVLAVLISGCGREGGEKTVSLFQSVVKVVGRDIGADDVTDFYYTGSNVNFDAWYQRYRFYSEDGKRFFFHETRERKGEYGPCTEEDITRTGTMKLTDERWSEFFKLISGGTIRAKAESADSGDSGPWTYLYWMGDKSKNQQYSFDSLGGQRAFEEYCKSLAEEASGWTI